MQLNIWYFIHEKHKQVAKRYGTKNIHYKSIWYHMRICYPMHTTEIPILTLIHSVI